MPILSDYAFKMVTLIETLTFMSNTHMAAIITEIDISLYYLL